MRRIGSIALHEFLATVATKGFIIGLLIFPAIMALLAIFGGRIFTRAFTAPRVEGAVAVIDRTGRVAGELRTALLPETIAAGRARLTRQALEEVPDDVRGLAEADPSMAGRALEAALGEVPVIELVERESDADVEEAKRWLNETHEGRRRLGLILVQPDAVEPAAAGTPYGGFEFYVPPNVDDRIEELIERSARDAIISARVTAQAMDRASIEAMMRVEGQAVELSATGERTTARAFNQFLPMAFMVLMFIGVMTGGSGLLTTTIEEKSSRVVEVLLSAVSPFELMAGKLIGQMGVSLVALSLYLAMGVAALFSFALLGLLDVTLILYFLIFFVIAYFTLGSLMMAVGAAVNDMREAQSLQGPIIIVIMIPWILWMPISRDPGSTLAIVFSMLPPINAFAMVLRMASSAPPPMWQVWLSIAIGIAGVVAAVWFASKVFRIGLLMFGKPPNLATLVRWVRAA